MDSGLKTINIWQQAVKDKNRQQISGSLQKILLVVGNSSVGKTSFLKVIRNEPDSQVKSTYLLDYSYIRRGHPKKQLIHCYQVATKTQSDIIPSLFTKDNFTNVTVAICIDLNKPSSIIEQVNEWMGILKKQVSNAFHQKIGMQEKYDQWQMKRRQENGGHQDGKVIGLAPLNVVIVGCKYDLYQKYQTENRKWLSRTVRFLGHVNNASVAFCSTKNAGVGIQLRGLLQQLMFDDKPKYVCQKDHLKPLFILRNQDSLASIAVPSSGSISGLEVLKRQLSNLFGVEDEKKREGIDISKYYEGKIQVFIEERKKEITKISKGLNKKNFA